MKGAQLFLNIEPKIAFGILGFKWLYFKLNKNIKNIFLLYEFVICSGVWAPAPKGHQLKF